MRFSHRNRAKDSRSTSVVEASSSVGIADDEPRKILLAKLRLFDQRKAVLRAFCTSSLRFFLGCDDLDDGGRYYGALLWRWQTAFPIDEGW